MAQNNMTLSGGNAAQNQYMNYYNQIRTQLGGNYAPVQAQVISEPEKMQAQQIATPDPIQSERIDWERQNVGQYASELDNYFKPYLENSMRIMRQNAADQRAAVDVDALSRGMSPSTWTTDAKNGIYKQLAGNIQSALSEYSRQLGEQAIGMWDSNEARALNVALSNAQRADEAAEFNTNLQNAIAQYNANALMNADEFNISNALQVALQNAKNDMDAQLANQSLQQYLEQLAWGWAGQMNETNPVVQTVYGGGGGNGNGVKTVNLQDVADRAASAAASVGGNVMDAFANSMLGIATGGSGKTNATTNKTSTKGTTTSGAGRALNMTR